MHQWENLLSHSISSPKELSVLPEINNKGIDRVVKKYPMLINPYYLDLIKKSGSVLYRQAVPDIKEIEDEKGYEDPLNEEHLSPVPGITHKYPGRVLFLVSGKCAMYCRFCNRKRKVGKPLMVSGDTIREGLDYIRRTKSIRDVLMSGGDPFLLSDQKLHDILTKLRAIDHVKIIRIGTRVPCTLPQRITADLANMLKKFHPLYINTHFNHPSEITPSSALACNLLADAGIPMGCQTVLLKGINDNTAVIMDLMEKLLSIRVKPYYLFQADLAKGTSHFWTPLARGIEIIAGLQGNLSGIGIPRFVIDLPDGGGKIPVTPEYIKSFKGDTLVIRNYQGVEYNYPLS